MKLFWTPARALVSLSARRALGTAFGAWCCALIVLLALHGWAPSSAWLGVRNADEAHWIESGLTRQGIWSGIGLGIVPFLVLRAARTVGFWRTGEVDWLGCRAASRTTILVWTWAGHLAAALLVLAAASVLIEARAGRGVPDLRLAGEIGEPGSSWVEGLQAVVWRANDPGDRGAQGSRARFELALGSSSGPGAQVILSARRVVNAGDAVPESRAEKRVGTRSDIEIEIPPGVGDLELSLACTQLGDRVFLLSKTGELWAPVASDRAATTAIFSRASIALAAWLALAIGLGAWMHATSATAVLLALMLPLWMSSTPSKIWPGGDIFDALAITGRGRVPPAIDGRSLIAALFIAGIGIGLARWSLVRWRREP